jgi:hypothetical protein
MTADEVVRRLRAFEAGKPLPRGETLRFMRLPEAQTLILAFVKMGGESTPWGVAYGCPGQKPQILTIPEPRTRSDVAEMVLKFAPTLLTHLNHPQFSLSGPDPSTTVPNFQVWLPNLSHLEMLHYLAYAYTFSKFGEASRVTRLNQVGHACGWLFREAQRPGQMITMVATEVLKQAYTFPAETVRLGHLGYLLEWLQTRGGLDARIRAAAEAERTSIATSIDPAVERDELAPYVEMYNDARTNADDARQERATRRIARILTEELERRFKLTERAISALKSDKRRENRGVSELMAFSMGEHRLQYRHVEAKIDDREDGPAFRPSPETDRHPSAAGSRFFVHEASQELSDVLLVHDDRELQAELIAQGEAISGTILEVRDEGDRRKMIPVWTVQSNGELPLRLKEDAELCVLQLPARKVRIRHIERTSDMRYRFEVEVTSLKKESSDGRTPAANNQKLKGKHVVLVKPSMDGVARRRSMLIWKRDVPGAWLTHRVPKTRAADLPADVAEDLRSIEGTKQ